MSKPPPGCRAAAGYVVYTIRTSPEELPEIVFRVLVNVHARYYSTMQADVTLYLPEGPQLFISALAACLMKRVEGIVTVAVQFHPPI
jgi:hypothetical protein